MNSFNFSFMCSMLIFGATSLGALVVYALNIINKKTERICLGLASGIMFAASIWSLLLPALESTKYIFVLLGFIIGIYIIIKLDSFVNKCSNFKSKKNTMLFIAMTLHNIPEGMTVGLMSTYAYQQNRHCPRIQCIDHVRGQGQCFWQQINHGFLYEKLEPYDLVWHNDHKSPRSHPWTHHQ